MTNVSLPEREYLNSEHKAACLMGTGRLDEAQSLLEQALAKVKCLTTRVRIV